MSFSLDENNIVVKYHYINNPRESRRAFYPCSIEEFERQVVFLKNNFKITTIQEVFNASHGKVSEKMCALTFDDGLKDNFENAIPILKKHGVTGTFFPITKTFEGFLPATHKMHVILSHKNAAELVDDFNAFLRNNFPRLLESFLIHRTERLTTERKMYDDIPTANLKETMNRIPRRVRDEFLTAVLENLGFDEKELSQKLFMSTDEIRTLKKKGHTVGSHAHSHEALDTMDINTMEGEIVMSQKILKEICGEFPSIFAYPQSAPESDMKNLLKAHKIQYALTTEARPVLQSDGAYHIPRYDTNHIRDFMNTYGTY